MKTVCLFSPGILPIPAMQGGAVETLLDIVIQQNEIYHRANLVVISIADRWREQKHKEYQYTKMIYIKSVQQLEHMYQLLYNLIRKVTGHQLLCPSWYYWRGYRALRKVKVDYLVAEGGDYEFFGMLQKQMGEENLFLHIHQPLIPDKKMDGIFRNIIGTSEFVTKEWEKHSQNPKLFATVVHNCVRDEIFDKKANSYQKKEIRQKLGFQEGDFILIFCGRIREEKGIKELLQAIQGIQNSNIKLLVIGSSEMEEKVDTPYVAEVKKLMGAMEERVKFTGYIENKELYKYYQIADVQVIPSLAEEAASLVAIEAMHSELPLIVTESGGLAEYIDDGCAIQLKKDTYLVENLTKTILELYENPVRRREMARKSADRGQRFIKENFYHDFLDVVLKHYYIITLS